MSRYAIWVSNGVLAVSTHADVMIGLRGHELFGGMTNEALRRPLTPEVTNPQWIRNAEQHIYTGKNALGQFTVHRAISPADGAYDTGWLERGVHY